MTTFLLAISFLLHLIILLALFVLFQRRTLERARLPSMKEDVETIHQSIQAFVDELEKENEALYENMLQYMKKKEKNWEARITLVEKKLQAVGRVPIDTKIELKPNLIAEAKAEAIIETESKSTLEIESTTESKTKIETTLETEQTKLGSTENRSIEIVTRQEETNSSNHQKAMDLYHQGFSTEQIAKLLQIGKGETQLIINMLNKQRKIKNGQ